MISVIMLPKEDHLSLGQLSDSNGLHPSHTASSDLQHPVGVATCSIGIFKKLPYVNVCAAMFFFVNTVH